ncbi:FISUMP domain-containing protein [Fibrobacter sp. UWB11]|uniref:FISUMP domain-containing protein n=1 Tax=Fibrobacter sp. UWB11 TaxID=1896202 RepID=UPI00092A81E2|nr:FISUMP domain-containing protein [Fibrobacter sp. UWB11]SIO45398.1 major paralogous domain-containing protein [Fibrobacter sp. UWB11]
MIMDKRIVKFFFICALAFVMLDACSATKNLSSDEIAESPSYVMNNAGEFFTDSRDGQVYRMVNIGGQTWMAENLNYKMEKSYCYDDHPSNCIKYGRLYTWGAAMNLTDSLCVRSKRCRDSVSAFAVQGACPIGWHLPTETEWDTLLTYVRGRGDLLSSGPEAGWTKCKQNYRFCFDILGEDKYGFAALPAGGLNFFGYENEGKIAVFWGPRGAIRLVKQCKLQTKCRCCPEYVFCSYEVSPVWGGTSDAFSVRCLRDEPLQKTEVMVDESISDKEMIPDSIVKELSVCPKNDDDGSSDYELDDL